MWSVRKTTVIWGAVLGFTSGLFGMNIALAAPNISFSSSETVISVGSSTTLNWTVTDAVSCEASEEWIGSRDLTGSEGTGSLSAGVKTFTLSCVDSTSETTTVDVNIIVADPPTLSLETTDSEIEYNTKTRLIWSSANATSCEKYGDWSGATGLSGDEFTENLISEKTFGISCEGVGGSVEKALIISISNPALQVALDFVADDSFIEWEERANLEWNATNADYCTASGSWSGSVDKESGSYETAKLTSNSTFSLYCANSSGSSVKKNITIAVTPRVPKPVTVDATADDLNIEYNKKAKITWTSSNADYCRVYYGSWTGSLATEGSYTSSNLIYDKTFTVRCYSWSHNSQDTVTINVGENPAPDPVLDFSADSSALNYNTSTQLNWSVENTTSLNATGDWSGGKNIPSGNYDTGNLIDSKTYRLTAIGEGGTVVEDVEVVVGEPTFPPNVSITADDQIVAYNEPTVVRWETEHADWCRLEYDSTSTTVGADGSEFTGNLTDDKTYTIVCGNAADENSDSATIQVIPVGFPPEITLTADTNPVEYGNSTTIHWTSTNSIACTLSGVGDVDTDGNRSTGNLYLPKTYTLTCTGEGGTSSKNLTIGITGTPGSMPTMNFWADDYNFYGSGSTTLHWTTTDADRCWGSSGTYNWNKSSNKWKAIPAGTEGTDNLSSTTLYTINCENVNGTTSLSLTISIDSENAVELEFYADNTEIEQNADVTLTWNGKNANWCQSYSFDGFSNWQPFQYQVAGSESSATIGPIINYSTYLYLRCWNYTSDTNWQYINITAGEHIPSILISAPSPVAYNSPASLSWFADYSESCTAWANPANPTWSGSKEISGMQLTSNLTERTYFYLTCTNSEGKTSQRYKRVDVGASNGVAPEISLSSDKYIAAEGEEFTLNWNVTDATWCEAISDQFDLWDGDKDDTSGSETLIFSGDQNELALICGNSYGSRTAIVNISKGGTELNAPNISFWADQMSLPMNGTTTLRWSAENAESCTASNGWTGEKAISGGQEQTLALATTTRFELHCSNVAGSTTATIDVVIGGPAPYVDFRNYKANDYFIDAGESIRLDWEVWHASSCYGIDPNGEFVGAQSTAGSSELLKPTVTTTYILKCENSSGEESNELTVHVAKIIVCPNPARIINIGNTIQLRAWFKEDADLSFSCSDTSGAIDITNGYDDGDGFFPTDWSSANNGVISVDGSGLATGLAYTETNGGPVDITAEYKESKGVSLSHVLPPPVTCWRCTEAKTCSSEITFPIDGLCASELQETMHECAKSCRKPVDWQETGS
ncbi:hypothetical protein HOB25_05040 [bacterium]|jgi:hypothetical protein|nr:hypothetical protein [bacterium]MBT4251509.1 hypothetical protein [bacterium]MBT4597483.1 hypothetical protein [bacterium]MBT6754322.1 hypothetical protein [bacterium]MBT7037648.1 hypothetical protein [bacterium]